MQESTSFPGPVPTRTEQTQFEYLRKGRQLYQQAVNRLNEESDNPRDIGLLDVAQYHVGRRLSLASRTWRVYKAALLAWMQHQYPESEELQPALNLIQNATSQGCVAPYPRKSALRAKRVSQQDLMLVIRILHTQKNPRSKLIATWLYLGACYGLRPSEWRKSDLILLTSEQIDSKPLFVLSQFDAQYGQESVVQLFHKLRERMLQGDGNARFMLKVRNHKDTNGRSHGEWRHLDITDKLNMKSECEMLIGFILLMRKSNDDEYASNYGLATRKLNALAAKIVAQHAYLTEAYRRIEAGQVPLTHKEFRPWLQEQIKKSTPALDVSWRNNCILLVHDHFFPFLNQAQDDDEEDQKGSAGGSGFGLQSKATKPVKNTSRYRRGRPEKGMIQWRDATAFWTPPGQMPRDPYRELLRALNNERPIALTRLTLYSGRHRFASTMKTILDEKDVAALMGHAVDSTAGRHYAGRDPSNYGGRGIVKPVKEEVAKIKESRAESDPRQRIEAQREKKKQESIAPKASPRMMKPSPN